MRLGFTDFVGESELAYLGDMTSARDPASAVKVSVMLPTPAFPRAQAAPNIGTGGGHPCCHVLHQQASLPTWYTELEHMLAHASYKAALSNHLHG